MGYPFGTGIIFGPSSYFCIVKSIYIAGSAKGARLWNGRQGKETAAAAAATVTRPGLETIHINRLCEIDIEQYIYRI